MTITRPSTPAARRPRRTTEEVRSRLLEAARELFLAHGYDATYTKDIAAKAGVAEKVLYSNFISKAGIFDAAFTEPFAQLTDRYIAEWQEDDADTTTEQRIEGFVTSLFELAHRNRAVLRSVLGRQIPDGRDGPGIIHHVARAIDSLKRIDQAPVPGVDQEAARIAVAGMVFGVVLLDDMLIPPGRRRPSRQRLQAEMTSLILHGVLHRVEPPPNGATTGDQHHNGVAAQ